MKTMYELILVDNTRTKETAAEGIIKCGSNRKGSIGGLFRSVYKQWGARTFSI